MNKEIDAELQAILDLDPRLGRSFRRTLNFFSAMLRGIVSEKDGWAGVKEETDYSTRLIAELCEKPEVRARLEEAHRIWKVSADQDLH